MASSDFNQAVRRLAQYRPFDQHGEDVAAAVGELMLASAAVQDGGFESLAACQRGIQGLWGIDVEIDELRTVAEQLDARGLVHRDRGGFTLTSEAVEELERRERESEEVERTAIVEWTTAVRGQFPDLTDDDLTVLTEDLGLWLSQVIARHGVESALVLYPENPRAQEFFNAIEQMPLAFLPEREGRCGEIRDWALQLFVRAPTPAQRTYLAGLLNTAFHMTVLTLDPEAGRAVQERVTGHRVYLDTNVIYALIGLSDSAMETVSVGRLLEMTRGLGYELAVTSWTLTELRTSLRAAENRLHAVPLPRQDLAALMAMKSGENAVTKAYWLKYRDSGIRPKDFFEYYQHVETLLEEHDVRVADEGCVAVDRNRDGIDAQLVVLERFLGGRDIGDVVKEHDVKHRLLIERLRGDGNIGFANARYWFLTRDSKLPRYAMATVDGSAVNLPFCVSTSAWLQVIRAFTPRTDDFDQSLTDLLATPYLRYRGGPGVQSQVVDAVVARVDHYRGATPRLAAEVLADTALVERISAARTAEETVEQIELAFVAKSDELRHRAEAAERREADALSQAEGLAADLERSTDHRERVRNELSRQVESARAQADLERREKEQIAAALDEERASASRREREEREAAQTEAEPAPEPNAADPWRRRFDVLAGVVLLLGAAALAVVPLSLGWLSGAAWTVALISVGALGVLGAIRLIFGPKHGPWVVAFSMAFCGVVGLIVYFVDK